MGRLNPQRVIPLVIRDELSQVRTCIPGRVESYDPEKQTAEVQILLKTLVVNGETGERSFALPHPIPDVPVVWPSGAGRSFVLGLEAGDPVTLMVCDTSTDEWSSAPTDNPQEPFDTRKFDLSDAFAFPGGHAPARALSSQHYSESAAVIKTEELRVGASNAGEAVAIAGATDSKLNNLNGRVQTLETWALTVGAVLGIALPPSPPFPSTNINSEVLFTND